MTVKMLDDFSLMILLSSYPTFVQRHVTLNFTILVRRCTEKLFTGKQNKRRLLLLTAKLQKSLRCGQDP